MLRAQRLRVSMVKVPPPRRRHAHECQPPTTWPNTSPEDIQLDDVRILVIEYT